MIQNLSRFIVVMAIMLFSSSAFAEDPPLAPAVDLLAPMAYGPGQFQVLVKGADTKVVKRLEMVLFSNDEGGQAVFKVKPKFEGCDFGLTLNF